MSIYDREPLKVIPIGMTDDGVKLELTAEDIAAWPVQGLPLTKEMRLMAALVSRLGGSVTLTPEELAAVKGVAIDTTDDGMHLTAN